MGEALSVLDKNWELGEFHAFDLENARIYSFEKYLFGLYYVTGTRNMAPGTWPGIR